MVRGAPIGVDEECPWAEAFRQEDGGFMVILELAPDRFVVAAELEGHLEWTVAFRVREGEYDGMGPPGDVVDVLEEQGIVSTKYQRLVVYPGRDQSVRRELPYGDQSQQRASSRDEEGGELVVGQMGDEAAGGDEDEREKNDGLSGSHPMPV